jgi:threonine/homoserine/homoserine lactone efflux protein
MLATLYGVYLAAAIAPGQDFLAIAGCSLGGSRRLGVMAALGVAAGTAVWVAGALLGLTALLAGSEALVTGLRIAGGAYLIHLGFVVLRASFRAQPGEDVAPLPVRTARAAFLTGFLANMGNPKTAIFFVSLTSVFITPDTPAWVRLAGGLGMIAIAAVWYSLAACLLSLGRVRRSYLHLRGLIDRVLGAALAGLGLSLLLGRA